MSAPFAGPRPRRSAGAAGMRALRSGLVLCCALTGVAFTGPYAWTWATHRSTPGRVLDAYDTPLPDGRVRISLLFEFTVPGSIEALGWRPADAWGRAADDLVVPAEAAPAWLAMLRPTERRALAGQVFYRANDPSGSAFIIWRGHPAMRHSLEGIALVLTALVLSLIGRNRR